MGNLCKDSFRRAYRVWMGFLLLSMLMSGVAQAEIRYLSIGTAGTSGVYYPYGLGLAELWTKTVTGIQAAAEITGGAVENIKFCHKGETTFGVAPNDLAHMGYYGSGTFQENWQNIRGMFVMYPNVLHAVAPKKLGIHSIADFRGRKVSVGAQGSGTALMTRLVLQRGLGIRFSEFRVVRFPFNQTIEALKKGKIDIGFFNVAPPAASIARVLATHEMQLIGFSDEQLSEIVIRNPFYSEFILPVQFYGDQNDEVKVPAVWNLFICNADADEKLIYELVKNVFENNQFLINVHPFAKYTTLENTIRYSGIPLHPGAINYLKEMEIEIPEHLLPR